jgi:transcriptional regulator with XRE-family HTH domain
MMSAMERDWARLGALLKRAARARGLQQKDIAERLRRQRGAIRNIETGNISTVSDTVEAYAQLVGWSDGSVDAVLAGGEPELASDAEPSPVIPVRTALADPDAAREAGLDDLSLRVLAALSEGPLVDSDVLTIPMAGGTLRAALVVRGAPDMTPDQQRQAVREWEAREQAVRAAAEGDEQSDTDR